MSENYISTHFIRTYTTPRIFSLKLYGQTLLVEVCCMETSINILGISGNSYITSLNECFLIVTFDLWHLTFMGIRLLDSIQCKYLYITWLSWTATWTICYACMESFHQGNSPYFQAGCKWISFFGYRFWVVDSISALLYWIMICQPTVGQHIDRYSTDMSAESWVTYDWHQPICMLAISRLMLITATWPLLNRH